MEGVTGVKPGGGVGWQNSEGEKNFTRGFSVDFASTDRAAGERPQDRDPSGLNGEEGASNQ